MKKILFGGTFNPIHLGHINMINAVAAGFPEAEIVVIPSNISYFKKDVTDAFHRYNMAKLGVAEGCSGNVTVSDIEIKRGGNSYTSDTIEEFRKQSEEEIGLLMGEDSLVNILTWHKPDYILKNSAIIVLRRRLGNIKYENITGSSDKSNYNFEEITNYINDKYHKQVTVIEFDENIQSSIIREMINSGREVEAAKFLPASVLDYIKINGLYV